MSVPHRGWLLSCVIGLPILALFALVTADSPARSVVRTGRPDAESSGGRAGEPVVGFAAGGSPADSLLRDDTPRATLLAIAQAPAENAEQRSEKAPAEPTREPTIVFNFQNAPWSQVLDQFSRAMNLSLVMDVAPPGTFSYSDDQPYTVTAALDLINRVLLAKGFLLLRKDDLLILVATDKPIPTGLVSVVEPRELEQLADHELVTLSVTLQFAAPEDVATEIKPILSTFGTTASLSRAKRLLITDLVVNLRKVFPLVTELDAAAKPKPSPPSQPTPPKVERIVAVEHADVAPLAETLTKFYTGQAQVEDLGPHALLVQATAEVQEKIADFIRQIDKPAVEDEPLVESVFPLEHLTAAAFAQSLQTLFPAETRNARFTADATNNAVLAVAPKSVQETVRNLVAELDHPAANQPVIRSYVPKRVSVDSLLTTLQALYGGEPARFTTDERRRRILVTAPPETQAKIAAMVEELDKPTDGDLSRSEHVYRLAHAKASAVASMLQTLYPAQETDARFSSAGGADDLLIVVASDSLQANVERLLHEIDQESGPATVERTYTPEHVRPDTLITTLQSLYGNEPQTRFATDPQGQTLIISAPAEVQRKIEPMLAQLDQPQAPERTPVNRIYKIEHANPGALIAPLQTLFPERTYAARFSQDAATGALIVSAPDPIQKQIETAIRQLDQPPESSRRVERVYELQEADPQAVVSSLQTLYGSEATFVVDTTNRAVIASASERVHEKIAAVVEQLDKPRAEGGPSLVYRVYPLRFATPDALASALRTVFEKRREVRILSDATNRSLVVVAPDDLQTVIGKMVEDADQDNQSSRVQEKVYNLTHAATPDLVETLRTLYGGGEGVRITPGPRNESIIVVGPASVHRKVESMLARLDQQADSTREALSRGYPLAHAQAESVASALSAQYGNLSGVTITADRNNNAVIVKAPAALQLEIAGVIRQVDQPAAASLRTDRVYELKQADPQEVLASLQTLYSDQARFAADVRRRLIVANTTDEVHEKIAATLKSLDQPPDPSTGRVARNYSLEFARPDIVTAALQGMYPPAQGVQILSGSDATITVIATEQQHERIAHALRELDSSGKPNAARTQRTYRLQFATPDSLVAALQALYQNRRDVRIVPDSQNRSLLVVAPKDIQDAIGQLVEESDQEAGASGLVETVYHPKHVDAASLIPTLTSLYGPPNGNARFSPGAEGHTLVIVAPAGQQDRIAATLERLDTEADPATRPVAKVYRLENTSRDSVVSALQAVYAGNGRVQITGGADPAAVTVVAPQGEHERIAALVGDMDRPAEPGTERTVEVIDLIEVDPFTAQSTIRDLYHALPPAQVPFVEAEFDPDRLVIRATEAQLAEIKRMLVQMGEDPSLVAAPGGQGQTVRTIRIRQGSPRTVAVAIEKLWPRLRRNPLRVVVPPSLVPSGQAEQNAPQPPRAGEAPSSAPKGKQPPPGQELPGDPDKPVVLTVTGTNLIAASDDTAALSLVERLARSLTDVPNPDQGDFTVFYLTSADATAVAESLDRAFNGPLPEQGTRRPRDERIRVVANEEANAVIVRAGPADLVGVQEMIDSLDSSQHLNLEAGNVHIVPLKQAAATEVAQILREVYADYITPESGGPGRSRGFTARRPRPGGGPLVTVSIGVDERSNSLVIAAPEELFAQMKTLIDGLETAAADATRRYRVMPLDRANSLDVKEALDILLERDRGTAPQSRPGGERRRRQRSSNRSRRPTSSIQRQDSPGQAVGWSNDPASNPTQGVASTTPHDRPGVGRESSMRNADRKAPTSTGTAVATIRMAGRGGIEVHENRPAPGATVGLSNRAISPALPDKPAVAPDSQANRPSSLTLASFEEPDARQGPAQPQPRPEDAADQTNGETPPEPPTLGGRLSDLAEIDALPDLNVILLWGTARDLEILGEIVQEIERLAAQRQLTFRLVPLSYVKASRLADLLDDLYTGMVNARGSVSRTEEEARVIPLAKPNAILLAAPENDLDRLSALIHQLDQPVPPSTQFRIFRLSHAAVADLADVVREFFTGRSADGELAMELVVTPDGRSNSLVVMASPRDMAEVARLVKDLDVETTASVNQMRVFHLLNTEASQLANVLQQAIQGNQPQVEAGLMLRLLQPDEENGRFVESGILENVRITANPGANTLVVSAPTRTMGLIAELIRELDVLPSTAVEIKVFTLEHSDAQRMGETLQTLFAQVESFGGQITPVEQPQQQQQVGPGQPTGSSLVPLSFSVDTRTNSLLVSGSPSQLEVVEAIIIRLDASDVQERVNDVYRLKNATANEVATALSSFLEQQLLQQLQQTGVVSPTQILERDVVVVPEGITNSLLISAVPRFYPEVKRLIEELDQAPPQVVIQVLIAQVTLTHNDEFGIELGIQDSVLFRRGIFPGTATLAPPFVNPGITIDTNQPPGVPGFNFNNQPLGNNPAMGSSSLGGQALTNFALERVGSDGFGGLVLSASSESISILLRALKAQGRIDILSRPQITTLDNQEAFIQVGQKVPIVTNSVITGQGSVINPVNFQDVGIILLVTPKINPDGTIVMRVGPEISSLSPSTVQVSNGVFAPIIDTTRAETTISAVDGQTVVIGGLITDTKTNQHRGVPFLSDIPILEWAFRFDQASREKRELLILMTPHVVRSPEDAERIKQLESERMDWVQEEVEEIQGPIFGIPAGAGEDSSREAASAATRAGDSDQVDPYFPPEQSGDAAPLSPSPRSAADPLATPELLPAHVAETPADNKSARGATDGLSTRAFPDTSTGSKLPVAPDSPGAKGDRAWKLLQRN